MYGSLVHLWIQITNFNIILTQLIPEGCLKRINCDQLRFIQGIQGWLYVRKANITMYYINGLKETNHMIISDSEKAHLKKLET